MRELVTSHDGRPPRTLAPPEITTFLNHLAACRRTSASAQNQPLCALLGLDKRVLDLDLPAVLGCREAFMRIERLEPPSRLLECLRVRVKDIDFDRPALLAARRREGLSAQLAEVKRRHQGSCKKIPSAATSFAWPYLFLASRPCADSTTGRLVLHLHESVVQKSVLEAARSMHIVDRGPLGVVSPLDR